MAHLAARFAVIFHVDDGRQRVRITRYITNEPVRLFAGVAAPVEEMVGTAANARFLCALPIGAEHRIKMITTIRRLDEGEIRAARAQLRPVYIGLPAGYIHPVDLEMTGLNPAEIDGLGITEAGAENARTDLSTGACRRGRRHGQLYRTLHLVHRGALRRPHHSGRLWRNRQTDFRRILR